MSIEEWQHYTKTHGRMMRNLLRMIQQANVRHAADATWGHEGVSEELKQFTAFIDEFERLTEPPLRPPLEPYVAPGDLQALGMLALAEEVGMLRDNLVRGARDQAPAHGEDSWSQPCIKLREMLVKRGVLDV